MNKMIRAVRQRSPFLGWFERLAALQAARLVAGCDQPAKRAHPNRFEISVLPLERC